MIGNCCPLYLFFYVKSKKIVKKSQNSDKQKLFRPSKSIFSEYNIAQHMKKLGAFTILVLLDSLEKFTYGGLSLASDISEAKGANTYNLHNIVCCHCEKKVFFKKKELIHTTYLSKQN